MVMDGYESLWMVVDVNQGLKHMKNQCFCANSDGQLATKLPSIRDFLFFVLRGCCSLVTEQGTVDVLEKHHSRVKVQITTSIINKLV